MLGSGRFTGCLASGSVGNVKNNEARPVAPAPFGVAWRESRSMETLGTSTPALQWDAFISHAWEDKESFVRPLAHALTALGATVWYDEFSLKLGDSLSASIDRGLAGSRYGIVVR